MPSVRSVVFNMGIIGLPLWECHEGLLYQTEEQKSVRASVSEPRQ